MENSISKLQETLDFCEATGHNPAAFGLKFGMKRKINSFVSAVKRRGRTANPVVPGVADIVNWDYYDKGATAAQATTVANSYTFFNQPIGTNNKTKADTNLEQVSRLPDPFVLNATHLGIQFAPNMILPDIQAIMNTAYIEFWVSQKVYAEGPIALFPAGMGVSGSFATTAAGFLQTWSNGWPTMGNMFDLRLPPGIVLGDGSRTDGNTGISILQGQNFKVILYFPVLPAALTAAGSGGTGMSLTCHLYGQLSRIAQ